MRFRTTLFTTSLLLFFTIRVQAEPLKPQQDPETQRLIGMGLEYAASAMDAYTYGLASKAYKIVLPPTAKLNDGTDLSAKALQKIRVIVESSINSAITDQTNNERLTTINQYLRAVHQQLQLVENRLAAGETEQVLNQTAMEDLRSASSTLVNLAGFQIESSNYAVSAKTAGRLYENTNFFFTPQFYLAASLRLKILALSEAFGGVGYRSAMQREAGQYLDTLQNLYSQFYEWNNLRFDYGDFIHMGNDLYAYRMGGQLQDKNTAAYIWRDMTLYKHRDYDFDNLKERLFTSGKDIADSWAAIAGRKNFALSDKKDPAALYAQAVYMSASGYTGSGKPAGSYNYTFVFSTKGNPARPDRFCNIDESVARSQSGTPIVGIPYLGLAVYNAKKVKCQPSVIEALKNGTSVSSDAYVDLVETTTPTGALNAGVYRDQFGLIFYVAPSQHFCTYPDMSVYEGAFGAPPATQIGAFPSNLIDDGNCNLPEGVYRIPDGRIFYAAPNAHYCTYPSWESYVAHGQPSYKQISVIPNRMISDGFCQ